MANDPKLEYLRSAYHAAFSALAEEVRTWIAVRPLAGDGAKLAEARVRAAEIVYRGRRDAFAALLIRREVERRAYRLWEQSGRPHGTADGDWYHAETLIPGSRSLLRRVA